MSFGSNNIKFCDKVFKLQTPIESPIESSYAIYYFKDFFREGIPCLVKPNNINFFCLINNAIVLKNRQILNGCDIT